ncbi:MAG: CBS domain-containing protein [Azospirillaceae bacterium]|nr:CBS domain-containing protein [Azospirillaceae bacterium]
MHVAAVLKRKGTKIITIAPDQSITKAAHLLTSNHIGAVPVVDPHDGLVGIISERDIVRGITEHGSSVLNLAVETLMTRDVLTCTPQETMGTIMDLMTTRRIRHLPVIERGALCGIISIGDAVKNRLDENELEMETLRGYLGGT